MTAGLLAIAVVLLAGTTVGLWRRRTDGRLRDTSTTRAAGSPPPSLTPPAATAAASHEAAPPQPTDAVPAAPPATASPAEVSASVAASDSGDATAGAALDSDLLAALGVDPAAEATLLQFSSAFCQPCRAVRRVSSEVAAMVPGVRHVEVDAESHLDAVRALNIWRTPTLLILDGDGREVRRATGVPGKPQLIAALGQVLDR